MMEKFENEFDANNENINTNNLYSTIANIIEERIDFEKKV